MAFSKLKKRYIEVKKLFVENKTIINIGFFVAVLTDTAISIERKKIKIDEARKYSKVLKTIYYQLNLSARILLTLNQILKKKKEGNTDGAQKLTDNFKKLQC